MDWTYEKYLREQEWEEIEGEDADMRVSLLYLFLVLFLTGTLIVRRRTRCVT
jgi:hypothetical protein